MTESFELLIGEIQVSARVEEQDNYIIQRQQGEIHNLVVTRARLKGIQESLGVKQINLDKTIAKLEQVSCELQILRRVREKVKATMKEQETEIAMLDDAKADFTREVEILRTKHIKPEDIITRQIQMLELMR